MKWNIIFLYSLILWYQIFLDRANSSNISILNKSSETRCWIAARRLLWRHNGEPIIEGFFFELYISQKFFLSSWKNPLLGEMMWVILLLEGKRKGKVKCVNFSRIESFHLMTRWEKNSTSKNWFKNKDWMLSDDF